MSNKFDKFTDDEIAVELSRRMDDKRRAAVKAKQARVEKFTSLLENNSAVLDVFDMLLPDHGRTTCQEDKFLNHVNVDRCSRCTYNWLIEQRDFEALLDRLRLELS